MDYSKFAYEDYKYMLIAPNEEDYYNRKLSLGAECCEKLLKQLVTNETNCEPDKTHSQRALLSKLITNEKYSKLRKYRALASELTEIYFTRRYPSEGYFDLASDEFEELYTSMLEYIKELVSYLPSDNRFYLEFYPPNTKTKKLEF